MPETTANLSLPGICFIVPNIDRIGGYEKQALSMARYFSQHGFVVYVVSDNVSGGRGEEVRDGYRIHRLRTPTGRQNLFGNLLALIRFFLQHRGEIDIVHCHAFTFFSGLAVVVSRVLKIPSLVKVATQSDVWEFVRATDFKHRVFLWALKRADRYVALSTAIREELLSAGISASRIILRPNAVDTRRFHPVGVEERERLRTAHGVARDRIVVLSAGRVVMRKGFDVLVEAFARLTTSSRARSCLVIVGGGEEEEPLKKLAARVGLAETEYLFAGVQENVERWIALADIFVLVSRREGSPNVILEAFACGVPVIGSSIPGIVDVLQNEQEGLLVAVDNPPALTAALERLICSAETRRMFSEHARATAEHKFSWDILGKQWLKTYAELKTKRVR